VRVEGKGIYRVGVRGGEHGSDKKKARWKREEEKVGTRENRK